MASTRRGVSKREFVGPGRTGSAHDALLRRRVNLAGVALAIGLSSAFAWLTRHAVNPDGVAYLDLARALRRGEWLLFVQGYWSPLYPALLAVVGPTLAHAHVLNAVSVIGGAVVLTVHGGVRARPLGLVCVWASYFLATFVLVRVSAVTPDMLLLVCLAGWFRAVTSDRVNPWLPGMWLGLAFLAKTAIWPWALATSAISMAMIASLRAAVARWKYLGAACALGMFWILPVSVKSGRFSIGVTGSLNVCWYLRGCDGRSPDTHGGEHAAYQRIALPSGAIAKVATFSNTAWTYAPWSDPETWARGLQSQRVVPMSPRSYAAVLQGNVKAAVLYTLSYIALGVLVPLALGGEFKRDPSLQHTLNLGVVAACIGVLQFIAVQAVTRTLAPFAFLLGAGAALDRRPGSSARTRHWALAAMPCAVALVGIARVWQYERSLAQKDRPFFEEVQALTKEMNGGSLPRDIAVLGTALPLMPLAEQMGVRIALQVLPATADSLRVLAPRPRAEALQAILARRARVIWDVSPDGRTQVSAIR